MSTVDRSARDGGGGSVIADERLRPLSTAISIECWRDILALTRLLTPPRGANSLLHWPRTTCLSMKRPTITKP